MATPIEIPISMPGAQQSAQQAATLENHVRKLDETARKMTHTVDGASIALNEHGKAARETGQAHQEGAKHTEHAAISNRELAKELGHAGGAAKELAKTFLTEFGAIGLAAGTVGEAIKGAMELARDRIEDAAKDAGELAKALGEVEESAQKAREGLGKAGAAHLEKGGDDLRALIAIGGDEALDQANQLAKEQGIDPGEAIKAAAKLRQGGLDAGQTDQAMRAAALLSRQGRGKFDKLAEESAKLGASVIGGSPAETASNMLNADALKEWNKDSKDRDARERADNDKQNAQDKAQYEKWWLKQHDFHQEFGGQEAHHDTFQPHSFKPSEFRPAPGTSADDLMEGEKRLRESERAQAIDRAAHSRTATELLNQGNALERGPEAADAEAHERQAELRNPGLAAELEKSKKLAQRVAETQAELEAARAAAPLHPEAEWLPGAGAIDYAINRSLFGIGEKENAYKDAVRAQGAHGDAMGQVFDYARLQSAVAAGVKDGIQSSPKPNTQAVPP